MQAGCCDARQKLTQAEQQRDAAQANLDKACKATQEQGARLGLVQEQLRAELLYQVALVCHLCITRLLLCTLELWLSGHHYLKCLASPHLSGTLVGQVHLIVYGTIVSMPACTTWN